MGETLDRQLREIRRREQTLSLLVGPADYTRQLQSMLAGYTASQKAALGAHRLVEESTRWQRLIDQLDHQRRFDELRRSTLMSSWSTWQASTESLSELLRSHPGAGQQDVGRLLRPIEEYSRYARGAVRQLVESTDEVEQAAVGGGLALAEEQVEESTALVADALVDGEFVVLSDNSGSSAATGALQPEASAIELPAHALVFYVQQRQLAVHGIDIVQATGSSLLLLSSAARLSQRIRSLGNLVLECNRAAKWAAQEEVFKPTTTWAESLHTMSYIAVSDRDSLGAFVDCLFHQQLPDLLLNKPTHEVVKRIPTVKEGRGRTPELTVEGFWTIVGNTPVHARPCYVVLAATGMRLKEYLGCTEASLTPATHAIAVPGTKTAESEDTIYVAPELWGWIEAGVPSPLKSRWMHIYWWRACVKAGFGRYEPVLKNGLPVIRTVKLRNGKTEERPATRYAGLRLHDLPHLYAQLASDEGAPTAKVQAALRHADPKMTRRYEMRQAKGEVAQLVGQALSFTGRNDRPKGPRRSAADAGQSSGLADGARPALVIPRRAPRRSSVSRTRDSGRARSRSNRSD